MSFITIIRRRYDGAPQEPYTGRTKHTASFVLLPNKFHQSARLARVFVGFFISEWKWIFATMLAIIGLYIAFKKLYKRRMKERPGEIPHYEEQEIIKHTASMTSLVPNRALEPTPPAFAALRLPVRLTASVRTPPGNYD